MGDDDVKEEGRVIQASISDVNIACGLAPLPAAPRCLCCINTIIDYSLVTLSDSVSI